MQRPDDDVRVDRGHHLDRHGGGKQQPLLGQRRHPPRLARRDPAAGAAGAGGNRQAYTPHVRPVMAPPPPEKSMGSRACSSNGPSTTWRRSTRVWARVSCGRRSQDRGPAVAKLFEIHERRGTTRAHYKHALEVLRLHRAIPPTPSLGACRPSSPMSESRRRAVDLLEDRLDSRGICYCARRMMAGNAFQRRLSDGTVPDSLNASIAQPVA